MTGWRISSHCQGGSCVSVTSRCDGGQCVEAGSGDGAVQIRDTADRRGPVLKVPAAAWRSFTARLKA